MALAGKVWSVAELLPHSGRMVLIDDVIADETGWVTAGVRIGEDNLFFEPGAGMPCWLGIEYMAQTVALYSGLYARRHGQPVKIGLLLGLRRYRVKVGHFPLGSYLRIHAQEEWQDGHMGVFHCTIDEEGRQLAEARINVFQPQDTEFLLEGGEA